MILSAVKQQIVVSGVVAFDAAILGPGKRIQPLNDIVGIIHIVPCTFGAETADIGSVFRLVEP